MSSVTVSLGTEDTQDILDRLIGRCWAFLGPCSDVSVNAAGDATLTFAQTLTAAQVQAVQDAARASRSILTPAERTAIQSDIDLLVQYQGLASPTLAQTVAATKAQNRVLRAILRS